MSGRKAKFILKRKYFENYYKFQIKKRDYKKIFINKLVLFYWLALFSVALAPNSAPTVGQPHTHMREAAG